ARHPPRCLACLQKLQNKTRNTEVFLVKFLPYRKESLLGARMSATWLRFSPLYSPFFWVCMRTDTMHSRPIASPDSANASGLNALMSTSRHTLVKTFLSYPRPDSAALPANTQTSNRTRPSNSPSVILNCTAIIGLPLEDSVSSNSLTTA